MNLTDLVQLGVGGISVVIIYFIVEKFLKFTKHQEDNFSEIIKNHLSHHNETSEKLTDAVKELLIWLKKNNH